MKKKIAELLKNKKFVGGCAAIALAAIIGGTSMMQRATTVPELPVYQDPIMEVSIEEEETPLASKPTVTTKTSKKTSKKKVKLAKASNKTYSKKLPTKKKTTSKTSKSSTQQVVTKTTVTTAKTEKYTKKSKTKLVTTVVTTTITTTTTKLAAATATAKASNTTAKGKYEVSISKIAPKADANVISAYQTLGFKVYVDSSVNYSGYFNAKDRSITVKAEDSTIYHELGHFLAFIAGNVDKASSFASVYSKEKNSFSGLNKSYVTQNASEYFAESYRDYLLNSGVLKNSRPATHAAVSSAVGKVTTAQVARLQKMYAVLWK